MIAWLTEYRPTDGAAAVCKWHRCESAARTFLKTEKPAEVIAVEKVDIPEDKAGLIDWLNKWGTQTEEAGT